MANTAILHTATRVIRRVTSDPSPTLAADETAVVLAVPIDLSGALWKLDAGGNKISATVAECRVAGIDDAYERSRRGQKRQALIDALDIVIGDLTATPALKAFAQAFKDVVT